MHVSYGIDDASTRFGASLGDRVRENTLAGSIVEKVGAGQILTNSSASARFGLLRAKLRVLVGLAIMPLISACSAVQTQENTLEQIATINNLRYDQVLTNISYAIDAADNVPSQGVLSNGVATNVASGSLSFNLTQPFAFAHNTKTFTPVVGVNWQNNWTITPIADPQDLQNLRALYSLLYKSDIEIAQFIKNTLILYASETGIVNEAWITTQQPKCGISWDHDKIMITNPDAAATSYFGAWNAFPEPPSDPAVKCYNIYGVLGDPLGSPSSSLATQYGLLYPRKGVVSHELRNGLSPGCRSYQINNLMSGDSKNFAKRIFRQDTIFKRWLFWKDPNGNWAPDSPPSEPEYLGKYDNRDFWTTSTACLGDFVVLAINATANSHAAAQNAPKPTGSTPATPGT
jgi:hypothetical protein